MPIQISMTPHYTAFRRKDGPFFDGPIGTITLEELAVLRDQQDLVCAKVSGAVPYPQARTLDRFKWSAAIAVYKGKLRDGHITILFDFPQKNGNGFPAELRSPAVYSSGISPAERKALEQKFVDGLREVTGSYA